MNLVAFKTDLPLRQPQILTPLNGESMTPQMSLNLHEAVVIMMLVRTVDAEDVSGHLGPRGSS